ncbi:hypothetical protein KI387_008354, partial [Taxus chinensis]
MAPNAPLAALLIILLAVSAVSLGVAEDDNYSRKPYIIHMIKSMKPGHFTSHHHWYASMLDNVSQSDEELLLYTYDIVLHGFSAMLSKAEAEVMESMDGCLAVIPSSLEKVETTRSPEFLGLASTSAGLWSEYSTYGEDVIVGMIDTGIWPESKSFNDQGLGPPPSKWKGECESGWMFNSSHCNNKIIGARYFFRGYEKAQNITLNETSPRDTGGHGTHTASIAAGAAVPDSNYFGFANGTARGMAPQARLAIYKACWAQGCVDADTVAAMEQAVIDGVDIISISIGSADVPFYMSPRAIATYRAIEKGVFVSGSAGNKGPFMSNLSNTVPWVITVGASSIDRDYPASVVLGNGQVVTGLSMYNGAEELLGALVYETTNDHSRRCLAGSLDPTVVKGKIVLCDRLLFSIHPDETSAVSKATEVARAGGAGMVVTNEILQGADQKVTDTINNLPSIAVSHTAGEQIKANIDSTGNNATAALNITGTTVVGNTITAPIVAAFSSRGKSNGYPHILKPDLIAPGMLILAAVGSGYRLLSGTSMACPHVSGIAALLKSIHPTWSPAAIKSALLTSSYSLDNAGQPIKDSYTMEAATPFAMGAGHVDPLAAVNPGLVYDMEATDFIDFLCTLNYTSKQIALLTNDYHSCTKSNSSFEAGDLNYPSFSVLFDSNSAINRAVQTKRRTVKYVGSVNSSDEGDVVFQV